MNELDSAKKLLEGCLGSVNFPTPISLNPFWEFLLLLNKWNSAYNLTALRDMESMIIKHILDSLAIAPFIQGTRILDVGTGAGLPGIPLALAFPQIQWVLLDSNGKKIRFLKEVKRQLQLDNVELIEGRVENYQPREYFDTVISRAFSSLAQMIQWTKHLITKEGLWIAMKGQSPDAELSHISLPYSIEHYKVQGLDAARCCVLIHNTIKEFSWPKS